MQAQSSTIQGGMIGNFINIYQQEGARGLWKVSLQNRASCLSSSLFPFEFILSVPIILFNLKGEME